MKQRVTTEQRILFQLLKAALKEQEVGVTKGMALSVQEWRMIFAIAKKHAVVSLLYEVLKLNESFPKELFDEVEKLSRQTVVQNYKLLYLSNYIVKRLEEEGVTVLLLKGAATAAFYPNPELRKSGDIDLLITNREEEQRACVVLVKEGYILKEQQLANHHYVFETLEGIEIELHIMLAEPFDNKKINEYLENLLIEFYNHYEEKNLLGSLLPVPEDGYHAYYLLLHMLQHYLRSGFGLKLLCDWVVFWNREIKEKDQNTFLRLISESGLQGFAERITATCVTYFGLEEAAIGFMMREPIDKEVTQEFIREIMEAEEFGKSARERMVVLRGTKPVDYAREFHHQMQLNYLKSGKYYILWPVLWTCTLVRFLYNNKKVRKTSLWSVLKKAHLRSRSQEEMKLFQIKDD